MSYDSKLHLAVDEKTLGGHLDEIVYDATPSPAALASIKTMPSDVPAERSVLSAMLLSPEVLESAIVELTDEDFFLESNRIIFAAMRTMFERSNPVDPISLADYLTSTGDLERAGGIQQLARLGEDSFAIASWRHHAEMLHRDTTLRLMIDASAKIANLAANAPEDTKEVVDTAEKMLLDVTNRDIKTTYVKLEDAMIKLYQELAEQAQSPDGTVGIQTGFSTMDRMFLGLRPGQMIVVGARPGVGKTSFALNLAVQMAQAGTTVCFFSLEMSSEEVAQRLLSTYSQVPLQKIRSADIKPEEWQSLLTATQDLAALDLMIDDTPGTTVTEVRAKARRMLRNKEKGIVILDYLQLVSPPPNRRSDSRATEVSEMSRGIKIMAKDLGIPVIALSQLSRKNEERTGSRGKRPQLSDLRESGAIEQDADIVILLDRSMTEEEGAREDRPDYGVTEFVVAKNRSGPLGIIPMAFFAEKTKFMEVDAHHDDA